MWSVNAINPFQRKLKLGIYVKYFTSKYAGSHRICRIILHYVVERQVVYVPSKESETKAKIHKTLHKINLTFLWP